MKQSILLVQILFLQLSLIAQHPREKFMSIAVLNTNTAMPFHKFGHLAGGVFHPGMEAGVGLNWNTRPRHDWYQALKAGYFFHRFIQHGIQIYTETGYRYKWSAHFNSHAAIGAGYMHMIPATTIFKLNEEGEYKKRKGIGRPQAVGCIAIGSGYVVNPSAVKPITIYASYQVRLQYPFVKSYVPLLPYNTLLIGAGFRLK